jgi:hypothetical protein
MVPAVTSAGFRAKKQQNRFMVISSKRDYILRLIEELQQALATILRHRQEGDGKAALRNADDAIATLLGPLAEVATRLDSASAAQVVGDADRTAAWARLLAAKAAVQRERGDTAAAATGARALALALEAEARGSSAALEIEELIAELRQYPEPETEIQ